MNETITEQLIAALNENARLLEQQTVLVEALSEILVAAHIPGKVTQIVSETLDKLLVPQSLLHLQ